VERRSWDANAFQRHQQLVSRSDYTFWELLLPTLIGLIEKQDGHGGFRVLDVGCGTGVLAHEISRFVHEVTGVDQSSESIKIASSCFPSSRIRFVHSRIEDYQGGVYDLAIAHMVFQTIANIGSCLESVREALNKGRCLIFSVPHPCFWPIIKQEDFIENHYEYIAPRRFVIPLPVGKNMDGLPQKGAYYHRSLSTYSSLLREAGFVIEALYEPCPNVDQMKFYRNPWKYPGFLFFECRAE